MKTIHLDFSVNTRRTTVVRSILTSCLFAGLIGVGSDALASPTVSGQTISWPDDGWYQVQNADTYETICEGGSSCDVAVGKYNVINHTTGERFEAISVSGGTTDPGSDNPAADDSGPSVSGNTISWPDNGWYQVQSASDYSSICQGGTSCEVTDGTYTVINLTTGDRYEQIVVGGSQDTTPNIVETAVAAGSFNTLVAALQATGLDSVLADENATFTVFAPTDDAIALLGEETISALLDDTETLSDILLYHVISGAAVDASTAISLAGNNATMANGDDVALSLVNGALFVNDSQVVATDIMTSNGIIHVIDAVLIPPADAPVMDDPVESTNQTILQIAAGNPDFSTLAAAVMATGLDGALGHPGDNYTVFAPTNAAFEALGADTINALLAAPDTLRDILLFHVIPGTVFSAADFQNILGYQVGAGNGGSLTVTATDGGLAVNGVNIIAADIQAVNGVIHVIDAVLVPPAN